MKIETGIHITIWLGIVFFVVAIYKFITLQEQIIISCMEQNAHIRYIEDSIVLDSTGAVSCFISKK